ncbi:MAG: exosortase N [Bacteroidetes bacterium]|jgi:exosortase N|nr:exosortase N [Bacteroidota bacterium]MBT6686387.1 exosortase N [Bacteroidota bacterium]MBT7142220.1 exosortase N [Bacteroidota bacterium]MBT7490425.1 exosortase N [Bacteroidota bacterium]
MEISLTTFVKTKLFITIALISIFVLLAFQKLAFYVRFDFNFLLLLLVLPFVIKKQDNTKSIRYGIIAIILFLLYPFLKLSSIYFFAFICSIFFIYEFQYGKLSSIPLFFVIIVSPVAIFLSEVVGFEIRLWLTKIATNILQFINSDFNYSGNIILIGKNEFHVDSECMGLKMVLLSMFITLIFITYHQHKKKGQINISFIVLSLSISYILVVISNLARIILITLFQSPPDTFSHELIGIICFIVYVVLPLWYVVKILPTSKKKNTNGYDSKFNGLVFISLVFVLLFLLSLYRFTNLGSKENAKPDIISLDYFSKDFSSSIEEHSVLKLTNEYFLIYIKPAASFYSADHSPIICWKGSGYKVIKEQIISTNKNKVYYSELQKDNDILYSTWWYDCGNVKTISQYKWRFNNLINGDDYRLINVISDNKNSLIIKTNKLLTENIFDGTQ